MAEEIPLKYSIPITFFFLIIGGLGTWLSITIIQGSFRFNYETDFLAGIRMLLTFEFLIAIFPAAIAIEFVYSKWKKRKLHPRSILIMIAIIGEAILVMVIFSFIFELAFPRLYFNNEPIPGLTGLALGLMVSLPALVVGLTSRIPKFREYVKRAFE